jgi:hypothetical protein
MCLRIGSGRLDGQDSHQSWRVPSGIGSLATFDEASAPSGGRPTGRSSDCDSGTHPAALREDITMVPGLTERERLIADTRRLEWLCDAVIGPVLSSGRRPPRIGSPAGAPWVLDSRETRWRGGWGRFRSRASRYVLSRRFCSGAQSCEQCCESFSWRWRALAGSLHVRPVRAWEWAGRDGSPPIMALCAPGRCHRSTTMTLGVTEPERHASEASGR